MLMNMFIFIYMFYLFVALILMSLVSFYLDFLIILEWMVFSVHSLNMVFIVMVDWVSLVFLGVISLISSMIMLYSVKYMSTEKFLNRFNYLMLLFIFSMILMVISPNIISVLIGWDGLGVVSYCLISFYQNYMSYNSAMVTMLCNRIGDVGILMSASLLMSMGSWNLVMMKNDIILMLMMLIAGITKSAQIPFSVWLPLAMAAPTPVSALVHSSTLVTAGVYLLIRFNKFLMESGVSGGLSMLSIITMLMAGLMANFENDFKKIIALSTLSQLGFMMMILSFGFKEVAFYHLLIHAIFKSMLFMAAGVIIHSLKNIQDIRLLGNLNEGVPFVMMSLMISNMALMGVPFMSGFYSKDLIMELIYSSKMNIFMMLLIIMSLSFTISYSIRFFYYLLFNSSAKFYSYVSFKEDTVMNFSMVVMMFLSIVLGAGMSWLFFFDYYLIYISMKVKLITLGSCFVGVFFSMLVMMISKILKLYYFMYFCSSMFFLSSVYNWVYSPVNLISVKVSEMDKSWVEFLGKYFFMNFLFMKYYMVKLNFYMFMCMFIYSVSFIYMFM